MSKESSRRGDTTASTYTDPGADTKEGYAISKRSRTLARSVVGNASVEDRVRQRCSVAVGDFAMAHLLRFNDDPVVAALAALDAHAPIITDIRMVQVGIQKKGHASVVLCALDSGAEIAKERDITRSSAGFLALKEKLPGAIVVIGNAPSALISLCSMIRRRDPTSGRDRYTGGFCQCSGVQGTPPFHRYSFHLNGGDPRGNTGGRRGHQRNYHPLYRRRRK